MYFCNVLKKRQITEKRRNFILYYGIFLPENVFYGIFLQFNFKIWSENIKLLKEAANLENQEKHHFTKNF